MLERWQMRLRAALPDIPRENLPIGDCRYRDTEREGWRIDNPPPGTTPSFVIG
jgi:hypothetical protein